MCVECKNYCISARTILHDYTVYTPSSLITFYVKRQNDYHDFNYFAQKFLIKVKSLLRVGIDFTLLWIVFVVVVAAVSAAAMNFLRDATWTYHANRIILTSSQFKTMWRTHKGFRKIARRKDNITTLYCNYWLSYTRQSAESISCWNNFRYFSPTTSTKKRTKLVIHIVSGIL